VNDVRAKAQQVLESTWLPSEGFCPPNPTVYPHQWLWDSCFHAIAWTALGDSRASTELHSCLSGRLPNGFIPHMRYLGESENRGPLTDRSSYTQPPIYAHAARVLRSAGVEVSQSDLVAIEEALDWLWSYRITDNGLVFIVHPWESGADDSPRWDSWGDGGAYDHARSRILDQQLIRATRFDNFGAAVASTSFVVAPAAFNAFVAHAADETYQLTGDERWRRRATDLAAAIDDQLWDDEQGLWVDHAVVAGGDSVIIPTLDGLLGALSTSDAAKAERAMEQVFDDSRFGGTYGLAYVPKDHPTYQPNAYWRGPAWPQLNYMMSIAAKRWDRQDIYDTIADKTVRGALASGFSEYWDPESAAPLGARPQGWAALAAVFGQ
jgi:hypothetical protein